MSKKTEKLNFEDSMEKLEAIVDALEEGALGLEESLDQFEKGMALAKSCETHLEKAQGRVEKIMKDFEEGTKIEALTEQELEP